MVNEKLKELIAFEKVESYYDMTRIRGILTIDTFGSVLLTPDMDLETRKRMLEIEQDILVDALEESMFNFLKEHSPRFKDRIK